tara:strand:- start:55 stop:198 length:144 start_codon:yes stop_codon:yes gene_type:complete
MRVVGVGVCIMVMVVSVDLEVVVMKISTVEQIQEVVVGPGGVGMGVV